MAQTTKQPSKLDGFQTLKGAFNDEDKTLATSGFLQAKVGHKIERSDVNATTEDFSFYDGSTLLYTLRIIYTDATQEKLLSAERIA